MGCAHFLAERYERAASWVQSGIAGYPGSHWAERVAVAAIALTGARDEARRRGRRLMRHEPGLTAEKARQAWPFTPAFITRLADGLAMARVPRG